MVKKMKVPIKIQNKRTVLICLIFLVIVIVSNSSAANNLTINSSNADDYKNLIDNYDGTDIIFEDVEIKNFSYYFNKKVNITGKNATLNNDGTKNIFVFSQGSSGSNVENLALTKSHIAISLQNVLDFTIKNVFIENANREGMSISKSKNINLINNTIQYSTPGNNYGVGLWMTDVNNVSIINNKLNHNGRYGLQVVGGNNLTVENSTFSNNSHTFGTNVWFQSVNGLNFSGNNVTLADGGFVGSGVSVRRGTGLSLDLYNKNVNIFNNNFSDNGIHGITVGGTNKENINIYDNIINHNGRFSNLGYGININPGAIATIYNNTLANNPIGIFLNGVNSSIYNNTIMNTTISFTGSSLFDIALIDGGITIGKNALNNEIFNNSLFKNIDGIMVIGGTNNTIKNNNISDNKYNGIYSSSNETTILNNLITNNYTQE